MKQFEEALTYIDRNQPRNAVEWNIAIGELQEAHRSDVESLLSRIEAGVDNGATYAQWVIEREQPKGYDKTVVRIENLRTLIEAERGKL